jgi:hypothetical protein
MQSKSSFVKLLLLSFIIVFMVIIGVDLLNNNLSWARFSGLRILLILIPAIVLPITVVSMLKERLTGRNTDLVFSEVALNEGFKVLNLKECKNSQKDLSKIPVKSDEFRDLTSFCFALSFRKEENGRKMYLCSADRYYIIFEFSENPVFSQNFFIKKFDNLVGFEIYFLKGSIANSIQDFNSTFVVNCIDCENTAVKIPVSIQEYLRDCRGVYPLDRNFKFIFMGPGGIAVAVNETGRKSDVISLVKFCRELASLLAMERTRNPAPDEEKEKTRDEQQDKDPH